MAATVAEIDGARCVHALAPAATCAACVDACPLAALMLDEDGLSLDTSLCDGCGLCVPACPRAAIDVARPFDTIFDQRGNGGAWAACVFSTAVGIEKLGCVHAIGRRDFDTLAVAGVRKLHALSGDCTACPRAGPAMPVERAAADHARQRISHGLPAVSLAFHSANDFERLRAKAKQSEARIDQGRRGLFTALLAAGRPDAPVTSSDAKLAYHTPTIDPQRCVACDACVHICPDDALQRNAGPPASYGVTPERCTGCGLCADICDQSAISVQHMGTAQIDTMPLQSAQCIACGAPYDWPAGKSGGTGGYCRICATASHHRNLFQVISRT